MKAKILEMQRALTAKAEAEKRGLNEQEKAEFEALQRLFESVKDDVKEKEVDEEAVRAAVEAERKRAEEITQLCRDFDVAEDKAKDFISRGAGVDEVKGEILGLMRTQKKALNAKVEGVVDARDKFIAAAGDALLLKSGMELEKSAEGAKELRGLSLRDLAIECLELEGVNARRWDNEALFNELQRGAFNPTAAFPAMLDMTINKAYVEGHKKVNVTFDLWTKKGTLKDFKVADNNYLASPAAEFLEVPEGGEIKGSTFTDVQKPTRQLKTYGRQFTLTRQAFINDDIELITKMPAKYARSARKTINRQVYKILVNNPEIYDGSNLFDATAHSNVLATGTGITSESLQAMILALGTQTDEFGEAIVVRPAYLVVPVGYAFEVYTLLYSPTINTTDNTQAVNPLYHYREALTVVEEPEINVLCGGFGNEMPWFLVADKDDCDTIQVDYLNGVEVPQMRRMEVPGTLGFIWDFYLDWGVNVMDFRGIVKNPGVAVESPLG